MNKPHITAIILAGGIGSRMMSDITKQRIEIFGKSVLLRTVAAFDKCDAVSDMIVVAREEELGYVKDELKSRVLKPYKIVIGGESRAESAVNGFSSVDTFTEFVAIHDCARCLITPEMIEKVINKAIENGAATAACAVSDTVKVVDRDGRITATLPRDNIFRAQTPQVFATDIYKKAIETNGGDLHTVTDDNMMVERLGVDIYCVDLGQNNVKITTKEDLLLAEFILKERGE